MNGRSWLVRITVVAVLLCSVGGSAASAQTVQSGDVAVSYSYLRLMDEDGDVNMPAGWVVSFGKPVRGSIVSAVGEVAGNYKSEFGEALRLHTFQGGVRVSGRSGQPIRPFAQFVAGVMALS